MLKKKSNTAINSSEVSKSPLASLIGSLERNSSAKRYNASDFSATAPDPLFNYSWKMSYRTEFN